VVECTALEMRHRCKPIGGSNPSLSASVFKAEFELGVFLRRCGRSPIKPGNLSPNIGRLSEAYRYRKRRALLRCSRQIADDRGPAGQFDPIAVRIEDHRYTRHVSKCYRCKTFAHALAS
jgi:hypothetical protein